MTTDDTGFETWLIELDEEHERIGNPYGKRGAVAVCGKETWREWFDDGYSAADALHEDLSYAL